MLPATNNATRPYRQGEQQKKPTAPPQAQGAGAPQPNAQPQTFAQMQAAGQARPAPPPPQQPQQQQASGSRAGQDNTSPYAQMANIRQAPPPTSAAMPQNTRQNGPATETNQTQGGYDTTGQGIANEGPGQGYAQETNQTYGGSPPGGYNGFNGQAPNYSPLDYMVGQMGQQPGTNFQQSAQNTQFQDYTPTALPNFQSAQTNYGPGMQVQGGGGGGGVSTNYQGGSVDPYALSQFSHDSGAVGGATQQSVLNLLAKPSGYDDALIQRQMAEQGGAIDDQFDAQDTAINEEMARRGLYDSSITAGRLKDSNIGRRTAKTSLADSMLNNAAMNLGNDQARAAGIGAGYQGQQYGEAANTFGLNQGAEQQQFGQQATQEQLKQGGFGLNQQGQIANSNAAIQSGAQSLQAQIANQQNQLDYSRLNSSNVFQNNQQALDKAKFGSGENQFATTTKNNNAQQALANLLAGGQQDFNNMNTNRNYRSGVNQDILNYGQQQFNNDMTQQQFNRNLSNDQWQQIMDSLGLK